MRKLYTLITMLLFVTMASSQATYNWNNAGGGDFTLSTNWTPNRSVIATNDILVFPLGTSYTVNNIPTQTVGRIDVSAGTVTFAGQALATTLQINPLAGSAELIIASGASLIQAGSLETIILGNLATADISGTYSISSGATYNANGISSNALTTVSGTGIIDNQGTLTSGATARLSMASGSRYIHAQNGGSIPLAGWDANSTIEFTGVTSSLPTTNLNQTYGNFTWNNSLQTATLSFNSAITTVNGDFSVQNTGTGAITFKNPGVAPPVNVAGDFNLSGGTLIINNTNSTQTLNVQGDVTISGGLLTRSGGTANFNFSGTAQTFTKTGGTISNAVNFSIQSGSAVDFGTSVLDGSTGTFTLASGGKIITANADGIRSTGAFGSIQVSGTRTYNSDADYEFRGATTGTFTTSTNPQVRNFTVNNPTGNVTLSQPMTVNNILTLTDGELNTSSTNLLTLADEATVAGVSNASFINGPVRKAGDDAFIFPTGRSGAGYVPIAISGPASPTTVITAEYLRGTPPNANNISAPGITHISGCDYWTLVHSAGSAPTIDITLNWNANSPCNGANYVTQPSTIKAVSYNGTNNWNLASAANGVGSTTAGTVVFANVTTFSAFAIGTTASGNNNPLPVLFNDVRAFEKNGGIQIEWSNLTERDLIEYVVERSVNGRDYFDYSSFAPKSNHNDKAEYTEFDAAPSKGANFYRIRVLEQGGKYIYSKVMRVDIGGTRKGFSLYPNPVIGKQVNLSLTGVKQGTYNIRVVTTTGQDVYHKSIITQASGITQTLVLPSTLKPGVYNMVVSGDGYSQNQLFIVQ